MVLKNGTVLSKEQLKSELQAAKISLDSQKELVRWSHETHGICFDTIEMYRKFCGTETAIDELDFVVPKKDLNDQA